MTETVVECHSGYTYAERPLTFTWAGQRLVIETIAAEWQTPQGKHFRVSTSDEQNFELIYDITKDMWEVFWHS